MLTAVSFLVAAVVLDRVTGQHADAAAAADVAVNWADEWAHQQAGSGRCQMILTSGYGYRQFIPLEAATAPPKDDPMSGYPSPLDAGPKPTPSARLRNATNAANATEAPAAVAATPAPSSSSATPAPGDKLVLRFQVLAESDAHILLSSARRSDRDAYEVVLGAGNNSYTDFRRLPASIPPRRAFNYTTGVVSSTELRAFWLLVDMTTGLLAVGPDGGAPLLAWIDPDPLRIKYFSLCTWTEVHGTWLYGCGKAGSPLLDAEWMTPDERVRQHVLTNDKKSAPHHGVDARAELVVGRVAMDAVLGLLSVSATMTLSWRDERLAWDPDDYGVANTTASATDVWVPMVRSTGASHLQELAGLAARARLELLSDGAVRCRCLVELRAACALEAGEYTCDFGLVAAPPVNLSTAAPVQRLYEMIGNSPEPALLNHSDWSGAAATSDGAAMVLRIRLRHRGHRPNCIFFVAFSGVCVCCVATLLVAAPRVPGVALASLNLVLTVVALLSLHAALPPAAAPHGVTCLSVAMILAAAGLLVPTVAGAACRARPPALPRCVASIMRSDALARVLLCRPGPPERPRWRECPGHCAEQVLEMLDKMDAEETRRDWMMLATALEKLCAALCLALASASVAPSLA